MEVLIKKYDNRRLYCVPQAKYVSLAEIKTMLEEGQNIKVVEKSTGKDITKYIMMQVLMEERYDMLPTYFYKLILQSPKEMVNIFFTQVFPGMFDYYLKSKENPQMMNMGMQNPFMQQFPNANMGQMPMNPYGFFQNFQQNKEVPKEDMDEKMNTILEKLKDLEDKIKE